MRSSFGRRCTSAALLVLASFGTVGFAIPSIAASDPGPAIIQVMNASAAAWSAGDLARFMDTYEDSSDTVYVGAAGTVKGKSAIEAMYAAHFGQGKAGALGQLTFDVIEIRPLGDRHALMIGRYHLRPPEAGKPEASGIFTLVFHEQAERWRIVCDHTS